MKVFKMNDFDWVCAKNKKQAIDYYITECGCDEKEDELDIKERNISTTMWYGFDNTENLANFLKEHKTSTYTIKYDANGNFNFILRLTLEEVIKLDNIKESCVIATTEF